MRREIFAVMVALVLALSAPVAAQETQIKNPSLVEFEPSIDHALITAYELDILRPDGTVLQTINLGKPAPVLNVCKVSINVQPIAFGKDYSARVRALAGTAASDYAVSVNKFERAPGSPSKLVAK
jgi:hypothetical protein